MIRSRAASSAVVLAVLVGCGGGGGNDGDEQVESTATSAGTASVATTIEPIDTAATTEPTEPVTTTVATASPTTTTVVAVGVIPGTATVALLTHGTGLGARPLLRWEAADGAVSYVVSVNAPNGGPLWAWEGSVTEVPFGGGPADDPDTTGAQLVGPATWFVAALDAEGVVIASSAPAGLAP